MNVKQTNMKNLLIAIFLILSFSGFAQDKKNEIKVEQAEKQVFRQGNDFYKQNNFVDAEVQYKKALGENPNYEKANYNLGNAIYQQNRFKEALPIYELVSKTTQDQLTKAESFHNIGNSMMKEKQYEKAVEAYKNSMRNNSKDDETRYNLALAQKMLKQQQDQNTRIKIKKTIKRIRIKKKIRIRTRTRIRIKRRMIKMRTRIRIKIRKVIKIKRNNNQNLNRINYHLSK